MARAGDLDAFLKVDPGTEGPSGTRKHDRATLRVLGQIVEDGAHLAEQRPSIPTIGYMPP